MVSGQTIIFQSFIKENEYEQIRYAKRFESFIVRKKQKILFIWIWSTSSILISLTIIGKFDSHRFRQKIRTLLVR